jgi:hypothetical protein
VHPYRLRACRFDRQQAKRRPVRVCYLSRSGIEIFGYLPVNPDLIRLQVPQSRRFQNTKLMDRSLSIDRYAISLARQLDG